MSNFPDSAEISEEIFRDSLKDLKIKLVEFKVRKNILTIGLFCLYLQGMSALVNAFSIE